MILKYVQIVILTALTGFLLAGAVKAERPIALGDGPSLSSSAWNFEFSNNMPAHPSPIGGSGWYFDFPVYDGDPAVCGATQTCPSVHYLTTKYAAPISIGSMIVMMLQNVATGGTPYYDYHTNTNNTCTAPSTVRLYVERSNKQKGGGALYDYYRWWSNPMAFVLGSGEIANLTVPLTPDQWSDVAGTKGDGDATAFDQFNKTLQNPGKLGMTFGGGCFFGHGVFVSGGTARFTVTTFALR